MASGTKPKKVKTSDFDDMPARGAPLFLIDGSSLAYRSFFALPTEIATSAGQPTNALLGFANMLVKLLGDYQPETVIVAWDVGGETERRKQFPEYKSQRPEMPDLLQQQWPYFLPLVEAFGFDNVSLKGYEADDVIGTLSKQASDSGIKNSIVTYDRDAMQLVNEHTVVMMTTKGVSEVAAFTPERVQLRYNVKPSQIADFIALRGDTSDNIPGIPGVGDKTAADLLKQFGSLESILDNIDKVTGAKRKENLAEFGDQSRMSKQLATIVCDLELDIDLKAAHAKAPDRSKMLEMFQTFEFRTLARRVQEFDFDAPAASQSGEGDGGGASGAAATPKAEGPLVSARTISPQELTGILADVPSDEPLPLVVEPVEKSDSDAIIAGVVINEPVPDGGTSAAWVALLQTSAKLLAEAIAGRSVVTFDFKSLPPAFHGGFTRDPKKAVSLKDDVLLSTYLLQPGRRTYLLGEILAEEALQVRLTFTGDDDLREIAEKAARLVDARDIQAAKLADLGMLQLYRDIEIPVARVLVDIENTGIAIDSYRMGEIAAKVSDQLDELVDRAHELAGRDFNLGSPKQLAVVLFDELGLPAQRSGKTGYSTDQRVLRDLRDMHPIIGVIESWRELSKLKNTYLDKLPDAVNERSGRIHTTFSQVAAATGRLSSIDPNLQNIPVRTAVGREIRSAFIPDKGNKFVACDYSQVELRLLANVSDEPKLIEIFKRGDDVHLMTAAEVADVDPSEVNEDQRRAAKAINFGIIYGISSFGLSQQLQISRESAQEYIERYLGRYPHVGDFMERTIEQAKKDGYVETLFGRRRPIPELKSRNYNQRQLGERLAVNTVLQGTAADIMKIAMVRVHDALKESDLSARIVLQIHDELLLEAPEDEVAATIKLVKREMCESFDGTPTLEVDSGTGFTWLDAK